MSANVEALQHAINRIAREGGFSIVAVDGSLGPKTNEGARSALRWVINDGCLGKADSPWDVGATCVQVSDQATASNFLDEIAPGGTVNQSVLAQQTAALGTFLNQIGNNLKLPADPTTPTKPSGGGTIPIPSFPIPLPSAPFYQASIIDGFKRLQPWQKIGLGLLAGVGILLIRKRLKARKGGR